MVLLFGNVNSAQSGIQRTLLHDFSLIIFHFSLFHEREMSNERAILINVH
jgi:hypothetical protein